ncbi:hypothetical protein E1293_34425 [Actinomadura darangshiensis]|uniref:Uncharacterized protein n=1 Tax=Actinomadura darangshiensis TaxID=705336 RepID=A0A4V2YSP5_9ACTN|nr:hypothetical protein [Actinomadura darangshiensis]TDD70827.1 hypothetical protein E1293_34425 [Actinomadura darangshiensis]
MRRQTLAALALVPALALGLQACGGDGGGAGSGATAKAASDDQKMREFAKCMRENGVDMPDPKDGRVEIRASAGAGKGAGPENGGKVEAAQKKCRHLMPNGGKPRKPKPEELAQMRAFSKCMRDHGISEFPDPQPDGGVKITNKGGSDMDPESQVFQKAQKACDKLAAPGGGMASTTRVG